MNKRIKEEFRIDGRRTNEIRMIQISHDINDNQHTITYKQGETIISCYISSFITKQSSKDKLKTTIRFQETAKNEGRRSDSKIDEIDKIIISVFEPAILSQYSFIVTINVTQDDGCLTAAIINSLSCLLAVNNILTLDFFVAVEVTKIRGEVFYDPNKFEKGGNRIVLCRLINRNTIGYINFVGKMKTSDLGELYEESLACVDMTCKEINLFLRNRPVVMELYKE